MSDNLQSKQAYLRENVLEMGYDADDFMSFLQVRKGENGLDLNNWNMDELISVVDDFVKGKKEIQNPKQEQTNEYNSNIITENINQNNNIEISNNFENIASISNDDNDSLIGKCQANEITSFSNIENINVKLSSPKKVEGKIFQKAYISYIVTTEPFNFNLNKRYSDFLWLKKILSLIYINCVVPPLCKKNYSERFTDYLIEKRMRSIEKFINGILQHPLMKNSEIIKDFLSIDNKREYDRKIEQYNKIKKPPAFVRQIKTMSGEVDIGINDEKEIYFENIKNYAKGNYQLLQKITKGYKSIMNIMQQLSNKMKDVSKLWKQVLEKSIKYSDSHNTSETFNIMSKLMDDWSEIQKTQTKVINVNIREYFRYVKNEFNGLKEMCDRVQNSKNTYIKQKEKLLKTKETLFEKQDTETWQLNEEDKSNVINLLKNKELAFSKMLPQETLKLQDNKNFYGCLLNSLISEFKRIRKVNTKRHKEYTTKFVKELSAELTNLHVSFADRLCEFNELKDDSIDYDINESGFIKNLESVHEKIDEDNNNIDDKNLIEEEDKNINENENIIIKNNNNIINNNVTKKNKDIAKDFEKIEHSDCVDNSKKVNDKDKDKNKKKEIDKKDKKIKDKKLDNKKESNNFRKEEKKEVINNNIEKKDKNNNVIKEKSLENKKDEEKKENIIENNIKKDDIEVIKKSENLDKDVIKQENKDENNKVNKDEIKEDIKKEDNNEIIINKDEKNENELKENNVVEKREEEEEDKKEILIIENKKEENKDKENKDIKIEENNK